MRIWIAQIILLAYPKSMNIYIYIYIRKTLKFAYTISSVILLVIHSYIVEKSSLTYDKWILSKWFDENCLNFSSNFDYMPSTLSSVWGLGQNELFPSIGKIRAQSI